MTIFAEVSLRPDGTFHVAFEGAQEKEGGAAVTSLTVYTSHDFAFTPESFLSFADVFRNKPQLDTLSFIGKYEYDDDDDDDDDEEEDDDVSIYLYEPTLGFDTLTRIIGVVADGNPNKIESLQLSRTILVETNTTQLRECVEKNLRGLKRLQMQDSGLFERCTTDTLPAFGSVLSVPTLKSISLDRGRGLEGAKYSEQIATMFHSLAVSAPQIETLDLWYYEPKEEQRESGVAIAELMGCIHGLKELNLWGIGIELDDLVGALADGISNRGHDNFKELYIGASIAEPGLEACLRMSQKIHSLHIFECHTDGGLEPDSPLYDEIQFQVALNQSGFAELHGLNNQPASQHQWIDVIDNYLVNGNAPEIEMSVLYHLVRQNPTLCANGTQSGNDWKDVQLEATMRYYNR